MYIEVADGRRFKAEGFGDLVIDYAGGVTFSGVFYVPGFKHCLLSVRVLTDKGASIEFSAAHSRRVHLWGNLYEQRHYTQQAHVKSDQGQLTFYYINGAYRLNYDVVMPPVPPAPPSLLAVAASIKDAVKWHCRLGHLLFRNLA